MKRIKIKSSNIAYVSYDDDVKELTIWFVAKSKPEYKYIYSNVSQKEFDELLASESAGHYFHHVIKPNKIYSKVKE